MAVKQAWQDWETELSNLDRISSKIGTRAFKLWQVNRSPKLRDTVRDYLEWRKVIPELLGELRARGHGVTIPPTTEEIERINNIRSDLKKWTKLFEKMDVFKGGITPTIPKEPKREKSGLEKIVWGGLVIGGIFATAALVRELTGGVKAVKGTSENVKDTVMIIDENTGEQRQLKAPGYLA